MNPSPQIAPPPMPRAPTQPRAWRTATEAEELTRSITWLTLICRRHGTTRRKRSSISPRRSTRPIPNWNSARAYASAAIPARYALERNAWSGSGRVTHSTSCRTGHPFPSWRRYSNTPMRSGGRTAAISTARAPRWRACAELRDATKEPKFDYFKRHLDLQMQAASAWIVYGEGRNEEAVDLLRRAADAEDMLGKHPVSPGRARPGARTTGRSAPGTGPAAGSAAGV